MRSKPLEVRAKRTTPVVGSIQTMNDAAKNIARLVEFLLQVRFKAFGQGDISQFYHLEQDLQDAY